MSETADWSLLPIVDKNVLEPLCEVLEDAANDVINEFLTDTPRLAEKIRMALQDTDIDAIPRLAHQLKSSCGALGGKRVQKLSAEAESQAVSGDLEATDAICQKLFPEIDALLTEITNFQNQLH